MAKFKFFKSIEVAPGRGGLGGFHGLGFLGEGGVESVYDIPYRPRKGFR
jgi:hypothetical protein